MSEKINKGIEMESSIVINCAPQQAYQFWKNLENFPQFMQHIQEVKSTQDNRYLWRVDGPLGSKMTWEADVTEMVKDKKIAWKTVDDSWVKNAGSVEFSPTQQGGTKLHVRLSYAPPAGELGHALATLLGINPEQQMGEDLKRCKQILEQGMTIEGVTRGEIETSPAKQPHA